ncbi:MAG TPA: DUF4389 domain-containing protein [Longimicrobiaceae bacterium]|nr:DUF4389 domain-containing protein [Longimicrobiaceae bacterium]
MSTLATDFAHRAAHPVDVRVGPATEGRDRVTVGFRIFLAIPHLILVGGPIAAASWWMGGPREGPGPQWGGGGGGVMGAVAGVCALIGWFAILFTGCYPQGLRSLAAFYLRWRVRAVAYTALLRDEYPPFGDGPYGAELVMDTADGPRDRLTVGFRLILAIPHLVAVWALGLAWGFTTLVAWFAILFTGDYPRALYGFAVGVLRWSTRVEAYLLLLHDEYPPFSLD